MKITYRHNPLDTSIELTDHEIEVLRLKTRIEILEELLWDTNWRLQEGSEYFDLEKARQSSDPSKYMSDDTPDAVEREVDHMMKWRLEALTNEQHSGDCTAHCASCAKCNAEDTLGLTTLDNYPGKHVMSSIWAVFNPYDAETRTVSRRTLKEVLAVIDDRIKNGNYPDHYRKVQDYLISHITKHLPEELQ